MNKNFLLAGGFDLQLPLSGKNLFSTITHTLFFIAMACSSLHLVSQHF